MFANISLVVLLNLLIKPVWVLIEMEIQDAVGHEAWGMYAALLSLGYLFLAFADLGINPYTTQKLASQPELLQTHAPALLSLKLVLMILYPILMVVIGWVLGYRSVELYFLGMISLIHAGTQLMDFFRANFRAMQRFKIDSFLSVFDRVFLLLMVSVLFYVGMSIEGFIYMRISSAVVGAILFYILLVKMYGNIRLDFDKRFLQKVMKASLPFAMMTILYSVHDKVDQVMIERIAGKQETGLYAAAYRWIDGFSMYLWIVLPIFFARFSFYLKDKEEQKRLLYFGQKIASIPIIFISIFGLFYGDKLLFLFDRSTPEELAIMEACLEVLFLALLVNGSFTIFSTLLTSTGHVQYVNKVILAGILLNIGLNFYFIPQYGAIASAWTTLVSFSFANLAYIWYTGFRAKIAIPLKQFALLGLLGVLLWSIFYGLEQISQNWGLNTLLAGFSFLAMVFGSGLISIKQIRSFKV